MEPNLVIKPSQWLNLGWYAVTVGGLYIHEYLGLFFLVILIYKVLDIYCWSYQFYDDILVEKRGILNVTQEEVHYFRIKSMMVEEPLFQRILDLSTINMSTSEHLKQNFVLHGITNAEGTKDYLAKLTKTKRRSNGIREMDIINGY
jgi:uncharacterized membrane protein YdbT with pleckstrin-like domain